MSSASRAMSGSSAPNSSCVSFSWRNSPPGGPVQTATREKVEHLIHKADGSIGDRNSYADDRRDRPG
jgi:hypothetical protein